jgi:OmpA-OmpF porin, OOP family
MKHYQSKLSIVTVLGLFFLLAGMAPAFGQQTSSSSETQGTVYRPGIRQITSGQKTKLKGRIVRRDADTFSIRDNQDMEVVVRLTDNTSVKSNGGFFRRGKNYDVTSLLRGLEVEVEGSGNGEGQLLANKVRFDGNDLKVARTVESRVSPVEKENQRIAGQVDELGEVSRLAKNEADRANAGVSAANERITAIDDYTVQDSVSVYFNTNSAVLTPEFKQALDELARKTATAKGYVIEITGHADSTGNVNRNRQLSQQRADAVVRYLQENHDIPLRRIVTPFGFGQLRPAADNTTAEGRRQNRRVEVKILVSRGISSSGR